MKKVFGLMIGMMVLGTSAFAMNRRYDPWQGYRSAPHLPMSFEGLLQRFLRRLEGEKKPLTLEELMPVVSEITQQKCSLGGNDDISGNCARFGVAQCLEIAKAKQFCKNYNKFFEGEDIREAIKLKCEKDQQVEQFKNKKYQDMRVKTQKK